MMRGAVCAKGRKPTAAEEIQSKRSWAMVGRVIATYEVQGKRES